MPLWYPYTQMQTMLAPHRVVGAEGVRVFLEDGTSLVDGISSWWSVCHGYQHPVLVAAMQRQLACFSHVMFAGFTHAPAEELAVRLCALSGMDHVFLTDSGSTSVETALKIAVQFWRNQGNKHRHKFVCFEHAYHGDTMGAMSLSDRMSGMHKIMNHYMPEQYSIPIPTDEYAFAEFDGLLSDLARTTAAVVIEPLVQGAGGMKFHSPDMLAEIYRITKKHGLLFIVDEVMTGFYRTGLAFAFQEAGIVPDIVCVGKALTGGMMTLAATLVRSAVYDAFLGDSPEKALMSGPTFMANPLACAVANASLDLFAHEPRSAQVERIEQQLVEELSPCRAMPNVVDVRVKGAIGVVQCAGLTSEKRQALREYGVRRGVWIRPIEDVLYLAPPFVISEEDLAQLCAVLREMVVGGH